MRQLYALEKLIGAVYALGTSGGSIRDRVHAAYVYHLIHIRPEDLPEGEMRRALAGIRDDLTFNEPEHNEGRLRATLMITSDEDASAIARRIIDLCLDLQSAQQNRSAPVVQIYQPPDGVNKVIHGVRWLPPDPNDHSRVIEPEP
jgi:hypothetical protein